MVVNFSVSSSVLVRTRFTVAAQATLKKAEELASAAGRRAPSGEELVLALLFTGITEPSFADFLDATGVDREMLADEMLLQITADERSENELVDAYRTYVRVTGLNCPVDCLTLLSSLLASEDFMRESTRVILERRGFSLDRLLAFSSASVGDDGSPAKDLKEHLPLGRLSTFESPELVGRTKLVRQLFARYKAGLNSLLIGPKGVGKKSIARYVASISGRPTVEVEMATLQAMPPLELAERLAQLERWLEKQQGGLLMIDCNGSRFHLDFSTLRFPVIATAQNIADLPHFGSTRRFRRLFVPELNLDASYAAVAAWATKNNGLQISPEALSRAVILADTYLRDRCALPGSAIDLLLTASTSLKQKTIDVEALESTVSLITGLPYAVVSERERERINHLEARLGKRVIGQRAAINAVTRAIRRRAVALNHQQRPMGVFLFLGPTGVGKTELARALAAELFGSDALIKFNMGDYQEKHEIAKFMGSPPGYVGSEEPGRLIKEIETHPDGGVLLFDEIEKAHPAVYDYLLAMFDDGKVVSNKGKTYSVSRFLCIMTSNLGSQAAAQARKGAIGFGQRDDDADKIAARFAEIRDRALKEHFTEEFRNRIDAIVHFDPLSTVELDQLLDLRLASFATDLANYRLGFELGPRMRAAMVAEAEASGMGGRELIMRIFPREIEDRFTDVLLSGSYRPGTHYLLELDEIGRPVFRPLSVE